jgi:gamma-glutamyltranspeptidase/glutathione hydrolase
VPGVLGRNGAVASGHPEVSKSAIAVLRAGGNAVDAAVAAAFTSFHAEPLLTSPGGGGFAVAVVDGEAISVDFFATAPGLGATTAPWMPLEGSFFPVRVDFGAATQEFHIGSGSVAVPSAANGLLTLQEERGLLGRAEVLEPARQACLRGTLHNVVGVFAVRLLWPIINSTDALRSTFVDASGVPLALGDTYRNPELLRFIDACLERGPSVFSHGDVAQAIAACMAERGGPLTHADLASYATHTGVPVRGRCRDAELLLAAPPSVGGMWMAYAMALLEGLPLPAPASAQDIQLLATVFAVAERARVEVVGDATPTRDHAWELLDSKRVVWGRDEVLRRLDAGEFAPPDTLDNLHGSTTHLSVVDRWGNACSVTVSNGEGSGLVLPGFGVFLNNFLGEADINPLGFHRFAPGARLGSAMCPMLARTPDGTVMATGSGGSNRIRTALTQVTRNRIRHGMTLPQAVGADRVHVLPSGLLLEAQTTQRSVVRQFPNASTFEQQSMYFGGTHTVIRHPDGLCEAVGDPRRAGCALAF